MSMTININPAANRYMPGMPSFPGMMMPGAMQPGMPGGPCGCEGEKKPKKKGILGELFSAIFGEDGLFGCKKKNKGCKCKKGCQGHGSPNGGVNIQINAGNRAVQLGV